MIKQSYPLGMSYDEGLGIDPEIIAYIRQSHIIESRISSTRCYLLQQTKRETVGSYDQPKLLTSFTTDGIRYFCQIWPSTFPHPDIRADINNGYGDFTLTVDGVDFVRVLSIDDIIHDTEYALVQDKTQDPAPIKVAFNAGFNPGTPKNVTHYFGVADKDLNPERLKSMETTFGSFTGWTQYLNYKRTPYNDPHQLLVRMPLTTQNLTANEEGLVLLREHQCWTIWEPYINEYDVLVVIPQFSPTGKELRFEVVDKQDSVIQGVFVSQRFKVNLINDTDKRYDIPFLTEGI